MSTTDPKDTPRESLTAGVRHAQTLFTVLIVLDVVFIVLSVVSGKWPVVVPFMIGMMGLLLGKWLFHGIESIITLLFINGERLRRIEENADTIERQLQTTSDGTQTVKSDVQPVTQDDPAHWPKQEPVDTGIDVRAALRTAEDLNRK